MQTRAKSQRALALQAAEFMSRRSCWVRGKVRAKVRVALGAVFRVKPMA